MKEVNQQTVWRVKLLRSGERVIAYVGAKSGQILEAKAEIAVTDSYREISPGAPTISLSHNR